MSIKNIDFNNPNNFRVEIKKVNISSPISNFKADLQLQTAVARATKRLHQQLDNAVYDTLKATKVNAMTNCIISKWRDILSKSANKGRDTLTVRFVNNVVDFHKNFDDLCLNTICQIEMDILRAQGLQCFYYHHSDKATITWKQIDR